MKLPSIHSNGTGKADLLEDALDVRRALRAAINLMQERGPNARDYYTQGPEAFTEVRNEHLARVQAVQAVLDDYTTLAEHIADYKWPERPGA